MARAQRTKECEKTSALVQSEIIQGFADLEKALDFILICKMKVLEGK